MMPSHLPANGQPTLSRPKVAIFMVYGWPHRKRNAELREQLETQMNESAEKLQVELDKQANAHAEAMEQAAL